MFLFIKAYADGWVTINGVHVFIGPKGKITKGPAKFIGSTVDDISKPKKSVAEKKTQSKKKNGDKVSGSKASGSKSKTTTKSTKSSSSTKSRSSSATKKGSKTSSPAKKATTSKGGSVKKASGKTFSYTSSFNATGKSGGFYEDARARSAGLPLGSDPNLVNEVLRKVTNPNMGMNGSSYKEGWLDKRSKVIKSWNSQFGTNYR